MTKPFSFIGTRRENFTRMERNAYETKSGISGEEMEFTALSFGIFGACSNMIRSKKI